MTFTTGSYSTLGLQQILTQLGYLPFTWTPAATAADAATSTPVSLNQEVSTAYAPPAGTFTFKPGYPSQLTSQWKVGQDNILDQGAIRAFESNQGLTMDGVAGPEVWAAPADGGGQEPGQPERLHLRARLTGLAERVA